MWDFTERYAGIAPGTKEFTVKYHVIFGISRDILRGILSDVEILRGIHSGWPTWNTQ